MDSHTAGIRVIHDSVPEKHTRLEHRAPGSNVNPYLSLAVMLLGGLYGIQNDLDPGDYAEGDPMKYERFKRLPRTLPESVKTFRESELTRRMLGERFVEHFMATKSDEWEDFRRWTDEQDIQLTAEEATDWEFARYFVWA